MKNQLDKETFYRIVKTMNPYGDRVYFASITWNGYDYYADSSDEQEALNKLWGYLVQHGHALN